MRWVLLLVGIVLMLVGSVWLLQGANILPGSAMSGQSFWAWVGGIVLIAGVVVFAAAIRRGLLRPR
ncbi:MAG: hypothetical protein ACTHNK_06655 [Thermomicrobiales bacterium]|jgi:hypothetical protein|nr:hypothetical protein [Thermomicrobiales bacterium]